MLGSILLPTRSVLETSARSASKKAGSSTRNRCKHTPGKRRGIQVFDGQRIPDGKLLVSQYRMQVMPGWNTKMLPNCNISSLCNGRVMITTEKINPKPKAFKDLPVRLGDVMPDYMVKENIYRAHIHILPDTQHQYFKLTEQI